MTAYCDDHVRSSDAVYTPDMPAHLIPIQQEAVNEDPDECLACLLMFFLEPLENFLPAINDRIVSGHIFLLV